MTENNYPLSNEKQKQGITYIKIPGEVAFNKKLNQIDGFVFWIIESLDCTDKHCWVGNEFIAKKLNVSNQTISNSISKLKKHEYLTQISFDGRKRILKINNNYHEKYRYLIEEYNAENENSLKGSLYAAYKESYKQPIKNLITDNNKDNNIDNTIINDRNRFETKSKNNIQILSAIKLITFWISLGHTTKHDIKNKNNKSYQQMIKYLVDLQLGKFAVGRKFDPEWIKKENIPETWFTKAWTHQELKEGLKEASKYSLEGYWPTKDKANFKSLSYILYNDWGQNNRSWLLTAMKNPPKKESELYTKIPLEETVNKLITNPIWPKDYKFDKYKLGVGLKELKFFADNLIRDPYNKCHQYFGSLALLLKEYLAWIDEDKQDWIDDMNQSIIGTGNGVFRKFIEAQSDELGIEIKSKGWK